MKINNGEKDTWEINKNATWCFEQIWEVISQKTAFHLTKHLSKTNKTCWVPPRKMRRGYIQSSPVDPHQFFPDKHRLFSAEG